MTTEELCTVEVMLNGHLHRVAISCSTLIPKVLESAARSVIFNCRRVASESRRPGARFARMQSTRLGDVSNRTVPAR
jgi:hypothetical protein